MNVRYSFSLLGGTLVTCLVFNLSAEPTPTVLSTHRININPLDHMTSESEVLVDIAKAQPSIKLDIRYATTNNFTGVKLYLMAKCYVRTEVAEKLGAIQQQLAPLGLSLLVFDAFRPMSAQQKMWDLIQDERYVANPANGGGRHTRGTTVDLTLAYANGTPLPMPTDFDYFGPEAYADYQAIPQDQVAALIAAVKESKDFSNPIINRYLLHTLMEEAGFQGLATEWWHFDLAGWQNFPVFADVDITDLVARDAQKLLPSVIRSKK